MDNQEIIFRLSMMEQHMQQLQQQLQAVENGITELESLGAGIGDIKESKGKEIFARIGRGIYAKARIISEELMVNVGDNNLVNKSVSETKEMIEEQVKKLKEAQIELKKDAEESNNEFLKMVKEYEKEKDEE